MDKHLETLSLNSFKELPLVAEGESKEVRYSGDGQVVILLKPTIYSYTHNRSGEVAGSDTARLRVIKNLLPVLSDAGVGHTYKQVTDKWILSDLVLQPETLHGDRFLPNDMSEADIAMLPVAPPIEVVAKTVHTGRPKHRYYNFGNYPLRKSGRYIQTEDYYPEAFIRFDWRNPMQDNTGSSLADEVLPEPMADWFIDTKRARAMAMTVFTALQNHFRSRQLDLWDICFFVTEDGTKLFGEVSPDGMRVRSLQNESLDKDIWRRGGSSDQILEKWNQLADILES